MHSPTSTIRPHDVLSALVTHPLRWCVPLVIFTVASILYAYLRPVRWEATQALVVREEAASKGTSRPGKFSGIEEMKTTQETVLELIKSRKVLAGALTEVGPPADYTSSEPWPSPVVIESFVPMVKLAAPKGAEFGKTEVFYLKVQSSNRQRSVDLASAICKELETQFDDLRYQKYQGVINELTKSVALAQADVDKSTAELSTVEREAGPDLAELRILTEMPSAESGMRRMSVEIETELRTYRAQVSSNEELLKLLEDAQENPGRLLASPSKLLESQPALRRLKDGLVDAQLRTAQALSTMSESHPAVQAARVAEREISGHLHNEIAIATKGLKVDLQMAEDRVAALEQQKASVQGRLIHLAAIRAQYSNLVSAVRHRTEILKTVEQDLSEAKASQASARTASLITLIGSPDGGTRPTGPSKRMIVLAGIFGGLLTGLGVVFLTVQPAPGAAPPQTASKPRPAPAKRATGPIKAGTLSLTDALMKVAHGHPYPPMHADKR